MRIHVVDEGNLPRTGARRLAEGLRAFAVGRGKATVGFSGGASAGPLLAALADEALPWPQIHVFQVDERVAPDGHESRNLTELRRALLPTRLPPDNLHPMPVTEPDLDTAARRYLRLLESHAGTPPTLDLVHLGLGADGHTASLIPGSPVLDEAAPTVAITGPYEGWRRMTLTRPVLSRARRQLWYVAGQSKADAVRRLAEGDPSIPASGVDRSNADLLLDPAAASELTVYHMTKNQP
jgi:6-phosphogluconolactonase